MKRILIILICVLLAGMAKAQKSLLSLDEHNKYIYYQVVDVPAVTLDSLNKNAHGFIKYAYPKDKLLLPDSYSVGIKDKFLTYTSLTRRENGEIAYTLNIECKDSKYRYWITDFVFTPYERDRYGAFVPVTGVNLPLETANSKIAQKELDAYLEQTGIFCKQTGEKLKKYMIEGGRLKKADQPAVKKIVTDKW